MGPQTSQRQEDFRFARDIWRWVELKLQLAILYLYLAIFLDFISLSYLCGAVIIAAAAANMARTGFILWLIAKADLCRNGCVAKKGYVR